MARMIVLNEKDNIAVALEPVDAGSDSVLSNGETLHICDAIPFGHKAALHAIAKGEHVIKYGASVGAATQNICAGEHVHIQNMESLRHRVK